MTLPRRGSRSVLVAQKEFRWRLAAGRPRSYQALGLEPAILHVQREGGRGVLTCHLGLALRARMHSTVVTPALVRRIVAESIALGWSPAEGDLVVSCRLVSDSNAVAGPVRLLAFPAARAPLRRPARRTKAPARRG